MTTEAIVALLPYLTPIILPIVGDIMGDILPGKYEGKLRKLTRFIRLILHNKGMRAKNENLWNIYHTNLAYTNGALLSKSFEGVYIEQASCTEALIEILNALKELRVLPPETEKDLISVISSQREIAKKFSEMFLTAMNQPEGQEVEETQTNT